MTTWRVERGAHGREVLGRVGLAQGAADGAAVAHQRVGDDGLGVGDDGEVLAQERRGEQVPVAGQGADVDGVALAADVAELAQVVDVDQVLGRGQAQLHHRQQAVTARHHPRLAAELREQPQRLVDAGSPGGSRTVPGTCMASPPFRGHGGVVAPRGIEAGTTCGAAQGRIKRTVNIAPRTDGAGVTDDALAAPGLRGRGPAGLGDGRRSRARRQRAGGVGGDRGAAAGARRRAAARARATASR